MYLIVTIAKHFAALCLSIFALSLSPLVIGTILAMLGMSAVGWPSIVMLTVGVVFAIYTYRYVLRLFDTYSKNREDQGTGVRSGSN